MAYFLKNCYGILKVDEKSPMLTCISATTTHVRPITSIDSVSLSDAQWIDLMSPTKEEASMVEAHLGFRIPTRAEMIEIEISSRLYAEHDALFMTATMVAQSQSDSPMLDPVTFIMTDTQLITIRYIEPMSFKLFMTRVEKIPLANRRAIRLFAELLDACIDRLADILELIGHDLDNYSKTIFHPTEHTSTKLDYRALMKEIGATGNLNTKAQESLLTFNRLVAFYEQSQAAQTNEKFQSRIATINRDISALSDHAHFLSTKINFLLDGTLGLVNIEQNNIIKIFSVAAVIFLPPTLIASIYGMNFQHIPELQWRFGYYGALGIMAVAAWLPYKYFKHKKWL